MDQPVRAALAVDREAVVHVAQLDARAVVGRPADALRREVVVVLARNSIHLNITKIVTNNITKIFLKKPSKNYNKKSRDQEFVHVPFSNLSFVNRDHFRDNFLDISKCTGNRIKLSCSQQAQMGLATGRAVA